MVLVGGQQLLYTRVCPFDIHFNDPLSLQDNRHTFAYRVKLNSFDDFESILFLFVLDRCDFVLRRDELETDLLCCLEQGHLIGRRSLILLSRNYALMAGRNHEEYLFYLFQFVRNVFVFVYIQCWILLVELKTEHFRVEHGVLLLVDLRTDWVPPGEAAEVKILGYLLNYQVFAI